jgi:hypothetical protein
MIDSGTVDVRIGPCEHTNDIRVDLWLSCDVPLALRYFTKPGMHQYPPESSHAHYTVILVTGFVLLSRCRVSASPWRSHLCLARWWRIPSHQEGPKNISPSSKEQIPLSSYLVPCQTFQWACKLSLWWPCYRWRLSNPKVHRTVRSDYDTLMV